MMKDRIDKMTEAISCLLDTVSTIEEMRVHAVPLQVKVDAYSSDTNMYKHK